ncbi:MAG: Omp28 family outer membrane lipoprotein [Muribaculaceae bacterium]|nr:Omp28 family outer membrane lipoprotein [Muribaculaceae bacterium]
MIMNIRNIYGVVAAGLLLAGTTACDDVKPDDRYILTEGVKAERTVLLEDFTGQNCLNCPDAHRTIKSLEEQYGDKLIAVSIHCGTFGVSKSRTNFERNLVGLMTDEGNAIMETYGITSFPMGSINMGPATNYSLWPTAVYNALQTTTDVTLDLTVNYTPATANSETGRIDMTAKVLSTSQHTANIQFWVVEDQIVALQRDGNQTITDYVHDGVFRGQVLPGLRGDALPLASGIEQIVEASINTVWNEQEHWVAKNLSIVAIISDATGVLQVARVPVIADEESAE